MTVAGNYGFVTEIVDGVPQYRGGYEHGCLCSSHRVHRECSHKCPCGRWRGDALETKILFHRLAELGLPGGETRYGTREWIAAGRPGKLRTA